MSLHSAETGSFLHVLHAFTYADAAARTGATGLVAADVGKVAKQTDTGRFYILTDESPVTWSEISAPANGGGGINYISDATAEDSVGAWVAYADAAGVSPVDGTGGSPVVTITRSTSSPLRGSANYLITKDASNRQGNGVSIPFSIDRADLSKMLQISFDLEPTTGFVASSGEIGSESDLEAYLYDVTNAVLIPVTPYKILSAAGVKATFNGFFQADPTSTSYRLILHVATTSATAWTVKFDNVRVGPVVGAASGGSSVSASYTRTATQSIPDVTATTVIWNDKITDSSSSMNTSTGIYTAPVSGKYFISAFAQLTANSTGRRQWTLRKNGGGDRILSNPSGVAGSGEQSVTGTLILDLLAGDTIDIYLYQDSGGALDVKTSSTFNITLLSAASAGLAASPIPKVTTLTSGSGTFIPQATTKYLKVTMVGGGGGGGGGGAGSVGGNGTASTFGTSLLTANGGAGGTTNGGTTTAGGTATISSPASGLALSGATGTGSKSNTGGNADYCAGGAGGATPFGGNGGGSGNNVGASAAGNTGSGGGGGGTLNIANTAAGTGGAAGGYISAIVPAGATYAYTVGSGGGAGAGEVAVGYTGGVGAAGVIYIEEHAEAIAVGLGGEISASYTTTAGQSIPNAGGGTEVVFATKLIDTHGKMNTSTGVYTIPESGNFKVGGMAGFSAYNSASAVELYLFKNGTFLKALAWTSGQAAGNVGLNGEALVPLLAGDTVSLAVYQNSGGSKSLISAAGYVNFYLSKQK